ncbi:MAG: hypothetical protein ACT4QE_20490 [Anaerolineales bacterium]
MNTIAKTRRRWWITGLMLASLVLTTSGATAQEAPTASAQAALGTAFTYQGRLTENGAPANGAYDFVFQLYDAALAGGPIGSIVLHSDVSVVGGAFTVSLDFGANAFTGEARWLSVGVRPGASTGSYTGLVPRQPLTPAPYALALPGLRTTQSSVSPNIIGGYHTNTVTPNVAGATIAGGGGTVSNDPNLVTDNWGTVSGGRGNQAGDNGGTTNDARFATVGGGQVNVASGHDSTVSGGAANTASGYQATVGGGLNNAAVLTATTVSGGDSNVAGGNTATVSGGLGNRADANRSTVPGGLYAATTHYGEMAYASGRFAATGDAQTSLYVLREVTTNFVVTELLLNGGGISDERLTIANGRTVVFDILVVGRSGNGYSAGWHIRGVIENVNGTTAFVGVPENTILGRDIAWEVTVAADDANDALIINVLGSPNTNIRWVATVRTVEVSW